MGAGEPGSLPIGLLLIPLILVITIGGFYLLARHLRRYTQEELKRLRSELRRLQTSRRQIEQATRTFALDDPLPYGPRARLLHSQLVQSGEQIVRLERQHVELQEQLHALAFNQLRLVMGAPYFWYSIRKEISGLWGEMENLRQFLAATSALEQALHKTAWEIALQAREVRQIQQQAGQQMDKLHSWNLQSEAFEAAVVQEQQYREALSNIPGYFLDGDESAVLDQAGKDSVTLVHNILAETRPGLEQLLAQAQAWEKGYSDASDKVAVLSRTLNDVDQTLDSLPSELDITAYKQQLDPLQIVFRNLRATLSRLEPENAGVIIAEAARLTQIALDMNTQLKRARRELSALEALLSEVIAGLKQLSLSFAALGARSVHPLVWGESLNTLTNLNRQAGEIGSAKKHRTPERVSQDLSKIATLSAAQKDLAGHSQQVEQAYNELLAAWSGPEFSQSSVWLQKAHQLGAQLSEYAPENWPKSDAVASLPAELEALDSDLHHFLPAKESESIPEAELFQRQEDTRMLAETYQKMQKRVENVQARLTEVQNTEKAARDRLVASQDILSQLAFLVNSNSYLSEVAASELSHLQENVKGSFDELASPRRGTVEKKNKQVSVLLLKIEQSANRWLDLLNQNTQSVSQGLSTSLAALDAIAPLDEASIAEARRLLSSSHALGVADYGGKSRHRLEDLVPEFKRRSDYWQACSAAEHALHDVDGPVLDTYQQAAANRKQVRDLFAEVASGIRAGNTWPPTSLSLDSEQQELDRLEKQWQSLDSRPIRAISLVQQLGSLSAGYQTLAERVHSSLERVAQEQSQVENLENEINELATSWESQLYTYRDNPVASRDMHELLDSIEREQAQIRLQSKRGAKSYSQVLQELKALQRKVKYFQAALDDDHALDSSGRVITRR